MKQYRDVQPVKTLKGGPSHKGAKKLGLNNPKTSKGDRRPADEQKVIAGWK